MIDLNHLSGTDLAAFYILAFVLESAVDSDVNPARVILSLEFQQVVEPVDQLSSHSVELAESSSVGFF